MQDVQLQKRHGVYLLFQEFQPLETAGFVYHEPAVSQARIVKDGALRELSKRLELFQCGVGAESAFLRKRLNLNLFPLNGKPVSLFLLPGLQLRHRLFEAGMAFLLRILHRRRNKPLAAISLIISHLRKAGCANCPTRSQ